MPEIKKSETGKIEGETKDGRKYSYDYQYADLAAVSKAVMPLLGKHGLAFTARPTRSDGEFVLAYSLLHSSGQREDGEYLLPDPLRTKPQQVGSAITYARRYCLCAVTGVAPEGDDDDAQAAQAAPLPKRASRAGSAPPKGAPLKGAALREHNALRRQGEEHNGKLERGITWADEADPWASVDANGERQPQGDLPGPEVPPGDRLTSSIAMHFTRLGFEDHERDERLAITAKLAGAAEIASTKDLSQDQAQRVRNKLERCRNRAALMELVTAGAQGDNDGT